MKRCFSFFSVFIVLLLVAAILYNPKICISAAAQGLILCGKVIIPSLFPFTFCVLFILKSGALDSLKIFKAHRQSLSIFLLSLIGGYPLGAKMLSEANINRKTATAMLNYCVNAGPAFIILSVGSGVFSSNKIGALLYFSHVLPSVIMAFLFRKKIVPTAENKAKSPINPIDNFVLSASGAASALISICTFVVLFSVICSYINIFSILKPVSFIFEITNAINQTRNIYLISFLLGFGGLCVWCQVFSLAKGIKINYLTFVLCRLFHGFSSAGITFLLVKIFKITIPTLSNGSFFTYTPFSQGGGVGISLIISAIVLIISLTSKNFAGNILEDVI